jgi:AraC-like DNA-binding protein
MSRHKPDSPGRQGAMACRAIALHDFANRCQCLLGVIATSPKRTAVESSRELLTAIPPESGYIATLVVNNALKQICRAIVSRYPIGADARTLLDMLISPDVPSTVCLLTRYLDQISTEHNETPTHPVITHALDAIRSMHRNRTICLQTVATSVGLSQWHLARILTRTTGHGFLWHLHQSRLAEATHLLRTTNKSVKEVAFDVGYTRTTRLDYQFKRTLGTTPSEFRDLYRFESSA